MRMTKRLRMRRVTAAGAAVSSICPSTSLIPLGLFLLVLCFSQPRTCHGLIRLKFALCPKSIDNPFFDVSRDGCLDRAKALTRRLNQQNTIDNNSNQEEIIVECHYVGPAIFNPDGTVQAAMVQELIDNEQEPYQGLSISIRNADAMRPVFQNAIDKNIPVVTYDSDDPTSGRATYIGTDNRFFGERLAEVVQQLLPRGGSYAIVSDSTPNTIAREAGVRDILSGEYDGWQEIDSSPLDIKGNYTFAIESMRQLAQNSLTTTVNPDGSTTTTSNLTAIIATMGGPMFLPEQWIQLMEDFGEYLSFVVADGLPVQLDFLSKNKVDGLVAQLPYEMGSISMDILLGLALQKHKQQQTLDADILKRIEQLNLPYTAAAETLPDFVGTNVLEHLTIPLVLPQLNVDQNYLGPLAILGWTLYGVILILSLSFLAWTYAQRGLRVVKVAQPGFLGMICIGVATFGAALVPLGFDDDTLSDDDFNGTAVCMAPIWLVFLGFTITFSALFAKLWRVNRLFHSAGFVRTKVTSLDVLKPFIVLVTLNSGVLLAWTLVDPLYYERRNMAGTDPWNRVLATYGTCVGDRPWPYVSILVFLNGGILAVANVQAYLARNIQSEFSEAKYVAVAVGCMLQACLIGGPILFVVKDIPQAWYLSLVFIIFMISVTVLLLIFVPKIHSARAHSLHSDVSQKRLIRQSISASRQTNKHRTSNSSNDGQYSGQRGSSTFHAPSQLEIQENGPRRQSQLEDIAENQAEDEESTSHDDEATFAKECAPVPKGYSSNHVQSHHESSATESLVEYPYTDDSGSFKVPMGGTRRPAAISDLTESILSRDETSYAMSRELSSGTARFADNSEPFPVDMPERKRSSSATSFPTLDQKPEEFVPSSSNASIPVRHTSLTSTSISPLDQLPPEESSPSASNVIMPTRKTSISTTEIPNLDQTPSTEAATSQPRSSMNASIPTRKQSITMTVFPSPSSEDATTRQSATDDQPTVETTSTSSTAQNANLPTSKHSASSAHLSVIDVEHNEVLEKSEGAPGVEADNGKSIETGRD